MSEPEHYLLFAPDYYELGDDGEFIAMGICDNCAQLEIERIKRNKVR